MKHLKKPAAAVATATLLFTLTAWGEGEAAAEAQARQTAPNGDVYNNAAATRSCPG